MQDSVKKISDQVNLLSLHVDMLLGDIWYGLEGLVMAVERASVATVVSEDSVLSWKTLAKEIQNKSKLANHPFHDLVEVSEKFDKALRLLDALEQLSKATGRSPSPTLQTLALEILSSPARTLVKQAQAQLRQDAHEAADISPKPMTELSTEEAATAQQQFDECVAAFKRHENLGKNPQEFFASREGKGYLNVLCLSYASHISEIYGKASDLVAKDQEALAVAGFLLNESSKRRQAASLS